MRLSLAAVGVCALTTALAQTDLRKPAGAEWPLVGGDWGNTRYTTLAQINPSNVKTLKGAWMARLNSGFGSPYSQQGTPVVKDGVMYITTGQQDIFALDAKTGNLIWEYRTPSDPKTPDNKAKRGVALGEGMVFGVEADIRKPAPAQGRPEPITRLFALDAKDGKRRWLYQRSSPPLSVRSPIGMVADRGSLITGFAGGKLVAISLANGAVRWEATVSVPRGVTELERVTDVVGVPVVAEREACAVAYQGKIGCFDLASGNALWSRELSSTAGLSLDARYVFVSDEKGAVQAMDRAGGATIWKQDKLFLRRLTAPLPLEDVVAVGDVEGYLHFLSRDSGAFVGRIATDGSPIRSSLMRLDQGLLVQTQEGDLFALSLK